MFDSSPGHFLNTPPISVVAGWAGFSSFRVLVSFSRFQPVLASIVVEMSCDFNLKVIAKCPPQCTLHRLPGIACQSIINIAATPQRCPLKPHSCPSVGLESFTTVNDLPPPSDT